MKKGIQILLSIIFLVFMYSCRDSNTKDNTLLNSSNENKKAPNIIYILADDLGYGDLSCYGQKNFNTPNIDKLASNGMLFTQHYSGSTVCAPSRSALLTGLHTGHTAIRGNKEVRPEGQHPLPDNTFTIAKQLKKAGYATGAFGKWGLGFPGSDGDPLNQGFDTFFGYNCQRQGHHYYPYHLWSNKDSIMLQENSGLKKGLYAPDLIHKKTLEYIESNKNQPFFLYVPSIIPHAELAAPKEELKKYSGKYLPEKSYKGLDSGKGYRRGKYESQAECHAAFVAMIKLLDKQVGEIVSKVEELGLSDNTIIVFTSDNGPHKEGGADPEYFDSNGELKGFKRDLYEGGIRVPMIASWPGYIKSNTTSNHISAFWDVFPTFSELAGLEVPKNLDGISFLPELMGNNNNQKKHNYLYWEFHERGGRQAVRMGDWKAVRYNVLKNPEAPLELYNLSNDIGEKNNLSEKHPEIAGEMKLIMTEARTHSEIFTFGNVSFKGN
ncbi:arylsulfatase [Seonamhaeicola sp. MEBiC1930]|uniref:arylsulfatase n=1 Tax=Seonamhaeicola sp. MEBiC01930 TaxID=2976768 RepID=UPI00324EEA54